MSQDYKTRALPWLLLVICLGYIFLFRGCGDDKKQQIEISIPAVVGAFTKQKPTSIKYDTVFQDTIVYQDKEIIVENPVNVQLAEDYLKAKDSISKLKLYIDAIQIRRYTKSFNDENVDIVVEAETTGTLNWIKPSYVIKERKEKVSIKEKETIFALYGGFSVGNNIKLDAATLNAKVGIQNRKGDIFMAEYGVLDQSYHVGYLHRFINFKK